MVATVKPSASCSLGRVGAAAGVALPLQPSHRPRWSRSASTSATARPPAAGAPRATSTRFDTAIRRTSGPAQPGVEAALQPARDVGGLLDAEMRERHAVADLDAVAAELG